jgi:uncharacterized integral membrane protein
VWALVGLVLIFFGLSNTETVVLNLLPENFDGVGFVSSRYVLPIFLLVYLAILTGILFGIVYEYFREHKYRLKLRQNEKELRLLRKKINELNSNKVIGDTEILNILDEIK